jgi:hypothetical protein
MNDQEAFAIAVEEAKISYREGGVPVRYSTLPSVSFYLAMDQQYRYDLHLQDDLDWGSGMMIVW